MLAVLSLHFIPAHQLEAGGGRGRVCMFTSRCCGEVTA
jgi:hypothetical protein